MGGCNVKGGETLLFTPTCYMVILYMYQRSRDSPVVIKNIHVCVSQGVGWGGGGV